MTLPVEGGKKRDEDLDKAFNEYQRQHDILLDAYNKGTIGSVCFDISFAEVKQIYINEIERIRKGDRTDVLNTGI